MLGGVIMDRPPHRPFGTRETFHKVIQKIQSVQRTSQGAGSVCLCHGKVCRRLIITTEHDSKHSKPLPTSLTVVVIYRILIMSTGLAPSALISLRRAQSGRRNSRKPNAVRDPAYSEIPRPSLDLQWLRVTDLPYTAHQGTSKHPVLLQDVRIRLIVRRFMVLVRAVCYNVFLWGDMVAHSHVDYSFSPLFPWAAAVESETCLLGVLLVPQGSFGIDPMDALYPVSIFIIKKDVGS
jgi:hypothetical protein